MIDRLIAAAEAILIEVATGPYTPCPSDPCPLCTTAMELQSAITDMRDAIDAQAEFATLLDRKPAYNEDLARLLSTATLIDKEA